jgi:hypothetical protein
MQLLPEQVQPGFICQCCCNNQGTSACLMINLKNLRKRIIIVQAISYLSHSGPSASHPHARTKKSESDKNKKLSAFPNETNYHLHCLYLLHFMFGSVRSSDLDHMYF